MTASNNKRILGLLTVLVLAVIAYFVFIGIEHSRLAKVIISVAPEDSVVRLDGQITHHRTLYIKPGNHTFSASRTDFKDDSSTVNTKKGKTTNIYLLPQPVTAAALQFLKNNPKVQTEREGIASQKVAVTQALLLSKYPIIKYLPLVTRYYTINYGVSVKYPNDPDSIAIYVTSDPANRDLALGWIKYKGFDPNKLEIIYNNP